MPEDELFKGREHKKHKNHMESISDFLAPIKVQLEELLLDPNNPRFAELGEEIDQVPESRFAEPKVQQSAFDKMKASKFNVPELRDTIKELGFLPMDRLVVRPWRGNPDGPKRYVVIEGNRRVSALKWLLELHESGKETFTDKQLGSFKEFEVLLLDDLLAPQTARWILPGLRHVSGIKEWGPYQKARMVFELRETGKTAQEVAQSLGLSTREANQLWRAYLALEQMGANEEYGEYAEPKLYSYFEEVFKRPNVREWLGWDDEQQKFINDKELREFYGWMKGEKDDDGELGNPKLPEARSIRDLSKVLDDGKALAVFRSSDGSLTHALARMEADHQIEFAPTVSMCETVLRSLSPDTLRRMTLNDIETLKALGVRIAQLLEDRDKLVGGTSGEVQS
jgi:hypothetical protein